jgi:hypothetical protein
MDLLFTLLLCSPYPAVGVHTARAVLREAHPQCSARLGRRRLCARTLLFAVAMVPLWPAVELASPLTRRVASVNRLSSGRHERGHR